MTGEISYNTLGMNIEARRGKQDDRNVLSEENR
jgi:hypothetical protein